MYLSSDTARKKKKKKKNEEKKKIYLFSLNAGR